MKLILLGDDVRALEQRLHESNQHVECHANRRLRIYLVGTFPAMGREKASVDRLVNFNTFGTPTEFFGDVEEGLWNKVADVPDKTIDLRVYVPTFNDMLEKEVRLTMLDLSRICRMDGAYGHTRALNRVVEMGTGRFRLQQRCLWAGGALNVAETALGMLLAKEDAVQDLCLGLRFASSDTPAFRAPALRFHLDLKLSFRNHFPTYCTLFTFALASPFKIIPPNDGDVENA
ncbi:hypothetical protein T440DRAFT_530834 [Plenodomus tracheiphilus IPT5]|uniref:Uncharacterized protein n=1 Tax=Plenodomus tracheiphilus IPT5 TaxID=1408161 RepID=A0A6A7ALE3_9PLEO|nr:hypothetical protein T440DRAFT_530834 [Plenodomus tracheiphilus IPT5]